MYICILYLRRQRGGSIVRGMEGVFSMRKTKVWETARTHARGQCVTQWHLAHTGGLRVHFERGSESECVCVCVCVCVCILCVSSKPIIYSAQYAGQLSGSGSS